MQTSQSGTGGIGPIGNKSGGNSGPVCARHLTWFGVFFFFYPLPPTGAETPAVTSGEFCSHVSPSRHPLLFRLSQHSRD